MDVFGGETVGETGAWRGGGVGVFVWRGEGGVGGGLKWVCVCWREGVMDLGLARLGGG